MSRLLCAVAVLVPAVVGSAVDLTSRRLPNEHETVGAQSLSFGNAGSVATGGLPSVRLNPGMLALEKEYTVSAGYNWPAIGRPFFQAGVVDSETSSVAAGLTYTAFTESYRNEVGYVSPDESPVTKRGALAFAKPWKYFSIGVVGEFVEGYSSPLDEQTTSGLTGGIGIAGLLTNWIRVGISTEHLGNEKLSDLAPETHRAGAALLLLDGHFTIHGDYRQRKRIRREGAYPKYTDPTIIEGLSEDEKLGTLSFSMISYDVLRIMGAYGASLSQDKRRLASAGVALVQKNFTLSYNVARPYLRFNDLQQSVHLSLSAKL